MTIRITEYYDCFDVKTSDAGVISSVQNTALPDSIVSNNNTNAFNGFNNFAQDAKYNIGNSGFATNTLSSVDNIGSNYNAAANTGASDLIVVAGKHKAPQAINSIDIDDNGNILCYPPNVSVPYWSRVVFKHFDYEINPSDSYNGRYKTLINAYLNDTGAISPYMIEDP